VGSLGQQLGRGKTDPVAPPVTTADFSNKFTDVIPLFSYFPVGYLSFQETMSGGAFP